MRKRNDSEPSVEEMFSLNPGAINLTGFTDKAVILDRLRWFLGREHILSSHRQVVSSRNVVEPSFAPEHLKARQRFFREMSKGYSPDKRFFDTGIPKAARIGPSMSAESFLSLCNEIYGVMDTAKQELDCLGHLPEAKAVLVSANQFIAEFGGLVQEIQAIDKTTSFAIDSESGLVTRLSEMPEGSRPFLSEGGIRERWSNNWKTSAFKEIRVRMKKQALKIIDEMRPEFRRKIIEFARGELKAIPGTDNFRACFEKLAMPVRLHNFYEGFLDIRERYNISLAVEVFGESWKHIEETYSPDEIREAIEKHFGKERVIPSTFTPRFGDHYDLRDLFPPELFGRNDYGEFVLIDFKTEPRERKFYLAGLHSGGKSFLLENLVLAHILGEVGGNLLGQHIMLPRYGRIFYYRNIDNHGEGRGKAGTELKEISRIIKEAEKNDAIFLDEFLDSTTPEVAAALSPKILEKLWMSPATVFVTSHRNADYRALARRGWTIMTPEYEITSRDEIKPVRKIKRGLPNDVINARYMEQEYGELFDK